MEPDRPEVEVLDTERLPGPVQEWVRSALRRPVARVSLALVVAVVLGTAWTTIGADEPAAVADADPAASDDTPPGLRPPPARGREPSTGDWRIAEDITITSGPRGHLVTFTATNMGQQPLDPRDLEVTASFVDRPTSTFRAGCSGAERTPPGFRTFRGSVEPQDTVFVRCRSEDRHNPPTPTLDPSSVEVRQVPCESERSTLPM